MFHGYKHKRPKATPRRMSPRRAKYIKIIDAVVVLCSGEGERRRQDDRVRFIEDQIRAGSERTRRGTASLRACAPGSRRSAIFTGWNEGRARPGRRQLWERCQGTCYGCVRRWRHWVSECRDVRRLPLVHSVVSTFSCRWFFTARCSA